MYDGRDGLLEGMVVENVTEAVRSAVTVRVRVSTIDLDNVAESSSVNVDDMVGASDAVLVAVTSAVRDHELRLGLIEMVRELVESEERLLVAKVTDGDFETESDEDFEELRLAVLLFESVALESESDGRVELRDSDNVAVAGGVGVFVAVGVSGIDTVAVARCVGVKVSWWVTDGGGMRDIVGDNEIVQDAVIFNVADFETSLEKLVERVHR